MAKVIEVGVVKHWSDRGGTDLTTISVPTRDNGIRVMDVNPIQVFDVPDVSEPQPSEISEAVAFLLTRGPYVHLEVPLIVEFVTELVETYPEQTAKAGIKALADQRWKS